MTVSSSYTVSPDAEDVTIEKDGGILKEILVKHPCLPWLGLLQTDAWCSGAR